MHGFYKFIFLGNKTSCEEILLYTSDLFLHAERSTINYLVLFSAELVNNEQILFRIYF